MNDFDTLSFCELRQKEVVNVIDGRRLGRIIDLIFCAGRGGEVKGIVVPYARRFIFGRANEVFVPMGCIRKIGEDVILIELILESGPHERPPRRRRRKYDAFEDGRFDGAHIHGDGRGEGERDGDGDRDDERDDDREPTRGFERDRYKPRFDVHATTPRKKEKSQPPPEGPHCDHKCEKCMLFDCAYRWKGV